MDKGIVNAIDRMEFCLVLHLTNTSVYAKRAVKWQNNFATRYVRFATNFYTG